MSFAATERVNALITLTERLTDLISQECRAFEARRPHEAMKTLEETSRLANAYRHESARIRAEPGLLEGAPRDRRHALRRATEAFDAVLARHGRALEAAKVVTEGIVRAVADEVVAQRTTGAGYGPGAGKVAGSATAITLNKSA
ncbi:MAG: flagellar basal body protein [Alphaproteobacteria bacterium]